MGMNPVGRKRGAVAEINVTPLVDVMLVLLVIFMISTPLMAPQNQMKLVEMNLPKTTNNPTPMPADAKKLILSISPRLEVFIGEEKITDCSAALAAPGTAPVPPKPMPCCSVTQTPSTSAPEGPAATVPALSSFCE